MNDGSWMRALAIAVLAVVMATVIGIGAYNAGAAHALVEGGGHEHWRHGFGFAFFPLFPLFFFFFVLAIMRRLWWGPYYGGRGWGPGYGYRYRYRGDVPPEFEEWHRRAHGEQPPPPKP